MKRTLLAAVATLLPLAACGSANTPTGSAASSGAASTTDAGSTTITVLAAASLRESFDQIAADYQQAHPGTTVRISYGGSSALAQQVVQGSPADLFAAASPATMQTAVASGRMEAPVTFATNSLEVAVPPSNPAKVATLADLARPGVTVALCQPAVPCGAGATKTLERAGLTVKPVTLEADVKSVLTKVSLGEVDAGIVYTTDIAAAAGRVRGVTIPDGQNTTTAYPLAVVKDGPQALAARGLQAWITSEAGQKVLASKGFGRS